MIEDEKFFRVGGTPEFLRKKEKEKKLGSILDELAAAKGKGVEAEPHLRERQEQIDALNREMELTAQEKELAKKKQEELLKSMPSEPPAEERVWKAQPYTYPTAENYTYNISLPSQKKNESPAPVPGLPGYAAPAAPKSSMPSTSTLPDVTAPAPITPKTTTATTPATTELTGSAPKTKKPKRKAALPGQNLPFGRR